MVTAQAPLAAARPDRSRPRGVLPALCVTQVTSWGVLYYAFPVLLADITADTGWSTATTTTAFCGALLVCAGIGIPVGRVLDQRGPRTVMTAGSVLGVLCLLLVATAPHPVVFTIAWLLAGAAMAATFYQPAFAAVTRWWSPDPVRALTIVTLAGGLASTVFAPLTAVLADGLGWRGTYLALGGILAVVTVPLHAMALRAPWPPTPAAASLPAPAAGRGVARCRPFLLLAAAMTLSGFVVSCLVIGVVPLMTERGASPQQAAWTLGACGVGQTVGRTLYAALDRGMGVTTRAVALMAAAGATIGALGAVAGPWWLLTVLAVLAGMVRGNLTLLQATAVPDRWGASAYGRLSALLAAPVTLVSATAPLATVALAAPLGGYAPLFTVLALVSALAAALALGTHVPAGVTRPPRGEPKRSPRIRRRRTSPPPSRTPWWNRHTTQASTVDDGPAPHE